MLLTTYQRDVLKHTLGLTNGRTVPYRNYFVADDGHRDMAVLEGLVACGLMERSARRSALSGDWIFRATRAGIAAVVEPAEKE